MLCSCLIFPPIWSHQPALSITPRPSGIASAITNQPIPGPSLHALSLIIFFFQTHLELSFHFGNKNPSPFFYCHTLSLHGPPYVTTYPSRLSPCTPLVYCRALPLSVTVCLPRLSPCARCLSLAACHLGPDFERMCWR
jgi:hypothetical protein